MNIVFISLGRILENSNIPSGCTFQKINASISLSSISRKLLLRWNFSAGNYIMILAILSVIHISLKYSPRFERNLPEMCARAAQNLLGWARKCTSSTS